MSGNPQKGSEIEICYQLKERILEVESLRGYVDSYVGGKGEIRSMEGMIQQIAKDCSEATGSMTIVYADLAISPNQRMKLKCFHDADKSFITNNHQTK